MSLDTLASPIIEARRLWRKLYKTDSAGGVAHCVTDDGNVGTGSIYAVMEDCEKPESIKQFGKKNCKVALKLMRTLLLLTQEQREELYEDKGL